jgi:ribonuclease HII
VSARRGRQEGGGPVGSLFPARATVGEARIGREPRTPGEPQIAGVTKADCAFSRARPLGRGLQALERAYWERGFVRIAGVDEVGMAPLAGPVVAAAVVFPPRCRIRGANDSKLLTAQVREALDKTIRLRACGVGIGIASVEEIASINIYHAGLLAMRRALENLDPAPDMVLVDARTIPGISWPQDPRIRGDATIHCVACASVVAKVYRDRMMVEFDQVYPQYGFARHKGYPTLEHRLALKAHGPTPIHRRSFHGVIEQPGLFPD